MPHLLLGLLVRSCACLKQNGCAREDRENNAAGGLVLLRRICTLYQNNTSVLVSAPKALTPLPRVRAHRVGSLAGAGRCSGRTAPSRRLHTRRRYARRKSLSP